MKTESEELPFYLQPFKKRLARLLKLYEILKEQNKQMPMVTLIYELHDIAQRQKAELEEFKKDK